MRGKALRIPFHLPVRFGVPGAVFEDEILNLSTGGAFIRTTRYHRPGSVIFLEFSLDGVEKTRATGKVMWVTEGVPGNKISFAKGLGVEFQDISATTRANLGLLAHHFRVFP